MKILLPVFSLFLLSLTCYSQGSTSDSTFLPAEVISDSTFRPTKADRRILSDVGDGVLNSKGGIGSANNYGTRNFANIMELKGFNTPRVGVQYWLSEKGRQGWFEYDPNDHTTADDNGTVLVTQGGKRYKRIFDYLTPQMFGAKADGITNDTQAFIFYFSYLASHDGANTFIPEGRYIISAMEMPSLRNIAFRGVKGKTQFICRNDYGMFKVNDLINVEFNSIDFVNEYNNAALHYEKSFLFSFQKVTSNLRITNCTFTMPMANATAIAILQHWDRNNGGQMKGLIDGLYIEDNTFFSIGQAAISVGNRDTTAQKYSYCKNIYINRNTFKDLGLSGHYGFALTLDGVGQNVQVNDNLLSNCYDIGIENTGYDYAEFKRNKFSDFRQGRVWFPFSFSTRPMKYNVIEENSTTDITNAGVNFIGVNQSIFRNNRFVIGGDNWINFRNCSDNIFENEQYSSKYIYGILFQSTGTGETKRNRIIRSKISNAQASSNNATISFEGANTAQNSVESSEIVKGTGGNITAQVNSASGNYIDKLISGTDNNSDSYLAITIPDADYTLPPVQDIINYKVYRFNGSLTATRNITFTSPVHKQLVVRNGANYPLNLTTGGGGFITLYPSQSTILYHNGTNFQSVGSSFAGMYNGVDGTPMYIGSNLIWWSSGVPYYKPGGNAQNSTDGTRISTEPLRTTIAYNLGSVTDTLTKTQTISLIGAQTGHAVVANFVDDQTDVLVEGKVIQANTIILYYRKRTKGIATPSGNVVVRLIN